MTPTTIELLKVWFIFSITAGCWTGLSIFFQKKGDRGIKYKVLALVALLLAPPLNAYISLINPQPVGWILAMSQRLTWCFGPVMLAIVQHVLLRPTSRTQYALQFSPFLAIWLHDVLELHWLGMLTTGSLLFIHVFGYLAYAGHLLWTQKAKLLTLTTQYKNSMYYWLTYLVGGLVVVMLIDVTVVANMMLGHAPPMLALAAVACVTALFVNTIALFSVYQPEVFFQALPAPAEPEAPPRMPLRTVELSPQAATELFAQLMELVESHKPHLDDEISLPKLASLLGVSTNKLSELLNIHQSVSFYDFLNNLRYEEALRCLSSDSNELTISDIAYRAGFNNRNTFYKVFKEKTGVTPHQFRKARGA